MAEIRAKRCQNGDTQKGVEIKQDVKLYIINSYVIEVFLFNSIFNTMFKKSWDSDKVGEKSTGLQRL